jgi:plastocyanin
MRLRKRNLLVAATLAPAVVALPTIASSEPLPVAAVDEGLYYHHWSNAQQTINVGEAVKFSNPYSATPYHGLKFTGGTAGTTPTCTGIPQAATEETGAPHWEGKCTFTKPGTYTFICTVHPAEMKGTITVTNGEPIVTTEAATSVGEHEATLNGSVNPNGKATKYHFKWGTTESYGQETSVQSAGEGTTSVPATPVKLSALAPATLYHYKLVAENEKGPSEGADQTFITSSPPPPPGPPVVSTGPAIAVGETQATLTGNVNPDGRSTKYFFEWGPTAGYGQATAEIQLGEDHALHSASATLLKLAAGTVYHFRLVAINALAETVPGLDQTFTTTPSPSSPPPSTPPTAATPIGAPLPSLPTPLPQPFSGPIVSSPTLAPTQHGPSVHGSLVVSQAGSGARLEVDLLAKSASLAKAPHPSTIRVGRLVRASIPAGKLSFSVTLTTAGKRALARKHRLPLTVRIILTPKRGNAIRLTRSITLRA